MESPRKPLKTNMCVCVCVCVYMYVLYICIYFYFFVIFLYKNCIHMYSSINLLQ